MDYDRLDTEEEYQALQDVYRHLCPLLNFYYPSMKLVEKVRIGSQVKKRYDAPQNALPTAVLSEFIIYSITA